MYHRDGIYTVCSMYVVCSVCSMQYVCTGLYRNMYVVMGHLRIGVVGVRMDLRMAGPSGGAHKRTTQVPHVQGVGLLCSVRW